MLTRKSVNQLYLFMCVSPVLLAGCKSESAPKNKLVGKWQMLPQKAKIVEFFNDGTLVQTTQLSSKVLTKPGTYRIVDDTHIIMTAKRSSSDANTIDTTAEYHISGNHLTMKHRNKVTLEFEKVD